MKQRSIFPPLLTINPYFKTIISSCFLLLFSLKGQLAYAQEDFKPKFGTVGKELFEASTYGVDSTAEAVVLYDMADVYFTHDQQKGLVINFKYWGRIKILKESALDRASVSLTIRQGNHLTEETLSNINGYTHNWDGSKVVSDKLERKAVARESSSKEYDTYKFNLPNVKKGSVIEYNYVKSTPFATKDNPDTWTFQGSIPFKWSEYRITIPNFLFYKITMGGYLTPYINKREDTNFKVGVAAYDGLATAYRFVIKDAPAFTNEPYITNAKDYLSKISFELSSVSLPGYGNKSFSNTWENVDKTLNSMTWFDGQLKKWSFLKDIAAEISQKTTNPKERMRLALAYIQQTIKWNEYYGIGSEGGVKKAWDNKKGNVSDINFMLISLLRELDLNANPLLLSTRNNGPVMEHIALIERFNYVVAHVKIGQTDYLLDGSQVNLPIGMLSEHALNGSGRVILPKGAGFFVNLDPTIKHTTFEMVEGEIDPAFQDLKGKYKLSLGGYQALNWRNEYGADSKKYEDFIVKNNSDWEIEDFKIENIKDTISDVVNINYNFVAAGDQGSSPELFYFNPMLAGRMKDHLLKNPFRIYPLDFTTASNSIYLGIFKIPDGFTIEEMPKTEIISLPEKAGRFMYSVTVDGNNLSINSTIQLNRIRFAAEEYDYLREFFDKIVQKHSQQVVLRKKKN